jgi:hypothetical protein
MWVLPPFAFWIGAENTKTRRNSFCASLMPVGLRSMMHHLKNTSSLDTSFTEVVNEILQSQIRVEIAITRIKDAALGARGIFRYVL